MSFLDKISSYFIITHHKQTAGAKVILMFYYLSAAFCTIGAFIAMLLLW